MQRRAATRVACAGLAVLIAVMVGGCGDVHAVAGAARRCAIIALRSIKVGSQPA